MSGGRPRKLDYEVVSNLRRNGLSVTAIAASFHVSREAVYHALRQGPGPGEATAAELRDVLARLHDAFETRHNNQQTHEIMTEVVPLLERGQRGG